MDICTSWNMLLRQRLHVFFLFQQIDVAKSVNDIDLSQLRALVTAKSYN